MVRLFIIIILFYGYTTSWSVPSEDVYSENIYSDNISLKEPTGYPFPINRQSKAMGADALPSEPTASAATVELTDGFSGILIVVVIRLIFEFCKKRRWLLARKSK